MIRVDLLKRFPVAQPVQSWVTTMIGVDQSGHASFGQRNSCWITTMIGVDPLSVERGWSMIYWLSNNYDRSWRLHSSSENIEKSWVTTMIGVDQCWFWASFQWNHSWVTTMIRVDKVCRAITHETWMVLSNNYDKSWPFSHASRIALCPVE